MIDNFNVVLYCAEFLTNYVNVLDIEIDKCTSSLRVYLCVFSNKRHEISTIGTTFLFLYDCCKM